MSEVFEFIKTNFFTIIFCINVVIALFIIFFDKKTPVATLAWVMILFMVPVLGLILYLVFSQHIARLKIGHLSHNENKFYTGLWELQKHEIEYDDSYYINETAVKWKDLIKLNLEYSYSFLTDNKEVQLITDGKEKFRMLLDDIRNAKESVNVCYFIIKNDFVGQELISVLTEKAREGVEVRLLVDAMGSKSIGDFRLKDFKNAGGKVAYFFKPIIKRLFIRFNYRNHRKIVVIDNEIGYIGGFNIAKEYLGYKKKFGYWRDTHIRIKGNSVFSLNQRFLLDWRFASGEQFDLVDLLVPSKFYTDLSGDIPIQIVSSGPDINKECIKTAFMKMITSAKKSIYIQTPYLVPDQCILESLGMAAESGVEVNVMIPCMPDHPFVYRTTLLNAGDLINHGVNIYIYENGFLHAKTLVVDDEVCTVGSTNFDIRSFRLNFETNAFIYDSAFAQEMTEQYHKDMEFCRIYTAEDREKESTTELAKERVSRLLTDIL